MKFLMNDPRVNIARTVDNGTTPFFIACCNGHAGVVDLLIDDPRIDVASTLWQGATTFFMACYNNHVEVGLVALWPGPARCTGGVDTLWLWRCGCRARRW